MTTFTIQGADVLVEDGLRKIAVSVADGRIAALDGPAVGPVIDGRGMILAPAMVDIHGDAFERQLMPRPGVMFPLDAAMLETDRQLAANGIATAFHALTLSWEPGLRSVQTGADVTEALVRLAPRLTVENCVQLRWETFCFEAIPLIRQALDGPLGAMIAFNDHTSMAMLHPGTPLQTRPFEQDADFPVTDVTSPKFVAKMAARAERSGITADEFTRLILRIWDRRPDVPQIVEEVAAMGRAAGLGMLSHDDSRQRTRDHYRALGARISEFPMNIDVARSARAAGDMIVFGAPNAARGGSHLGSPGAAGMVAAGLCDILASDYYYPAMLSAVARLVADGAGSLAQMWALVSANPAKAAGLRDRGTIAAGLRADLVLLDWPEGGTPAIRRTFVAGRTAYMAEGRDAGVNGRNASSTATATSPNPHENTYIIA